MPTSWHEDTIILRLAGLFNSRTEIDKYLNRCPPIVVEHLLHCPHLCFKASVTSGTVVQETTSHPS